MAKPFTVDAGTAGASKRLVVDEAFIVDAGTADASKWKLDKALTKCFAGIETETVTLPAKFVVRAEAGAGAGAGGEDEDDDDDDDEDEDDDDDDDEDDDDDDDDDEAEAEAAGRQRHMLYVGRSGGFARIQWKDFTDPVSRPLEFPSRPVTAETLRGWPGYIDAAGVVLQHNTSGAAVTTAAASYVSNVWQIHVITERGTRATLTRANGAWSGYSEAPKARSGLITAIRSVGDSSLRAQALKLLNESVSGSFYAKCAFSDTAMD